jgi:5-(carboxyamino)imidazole ribonucleotide synthase
MFAIAARRMGYRVHTFSPDADTPTGQVADVEVIASYDDLDAVRQFARDVSVVTFEFENVPAATADAAGEFAPVRPAGHILHTTQHRIREKTFLSAAGLPLTPFRTVHSSDDLARAVAELGTPSILKTADFGYDGKGQVRLNTPADAEPAWTSIGRVPAVLEAFIPFEREVSVVACTILRRRFRRLGCGREPPPQSHPRRHDGDPALVSADVARRAREIARTGARQTRRSSAFCASSSSSSPTAIC